MSQEGSRLLPSGLGLFGDSYDVPGGWWTVPFRPWRYDWTVGVTGHDGALTGDCTGSSLVTDTGTLSPVLHK